MSAESNQNDTHFEESPPHPDRAEGAEAAPASEARVKAPLHGIGERIGRYMILEMLGKGGMGVVYKAYDPDLDRRVALKVLRTRAGDAKRLERRRARLLREAQALAQLAHPNVVAVHDVGTQGEEIFLAMELVDGKTLHQWLKNDKPSFAQILQVFIAAGQGLSAAHRRGIVHRDFKPDNVIVGTDGRVRVLDFGLARGAGAEGSKNASGSEPDDPGPSSGEPYAGESEAPTEGSRSGTGTQRLLHTALTQEGVRVGTVRYMAPEHFLGETISEKSDQFAFCVALFEAVYGRHPFAGDNDSALSLSILQGRVSFPESGAKVPEWVRALLLRGLSLAPAQRFGTMDELLAQLGRDPDRRRRVILAVAALALLITAISGLVGYGVQRANQRCHEADSRLGDIWDGKVAADLRAAFARTGRPYASASASEVERILSTYARDWGEMFTEACKATWVHGEQSQDVLDQRMRCLTGRREELKRFIELLAQADGNAVQKAVSAASELSPVRDCAASRVNERRGIYAVSEGKRGKLEELLALMARERATRAIGRYQDAQVELSRLLASARELGVGALIAELAFERAYVLAKTGEFEGSQDALYDALEAADAAADDEVRARAESFLIFLVGYQMGRPIDLAHMSRRARAVISRLSDRPALLAEWHRNLGAVLMQRGDYKAALAHFEETLQIHRELVGPSSTLVAIDLSNISGALSKLNRLTEAREHSERASSLLERALGAQHPDVCIPLNNLCLVLSEQGEFESSLHCYQRALDIQERAGGKEHAFTSYLHHNLAQVYRKLGRFDQALWHFGRTLEIEKASMGEKSVFVAETLAGLGETYQKMGRLAQASAHYQSALQINQEVLGGKNAFEAEVLIKQAALALDQRALSTSAALLARARALLPGIEEVGLLRAEQDFVQARLMWESGGDRAKALSLAEEARKAAQTLPPSAELRRNLDSWLSQHRSL